MPFCELAMVTTALPAAAEVRVHNAIAQCKGAAQSADQSGSIRLTSATSYACTWQETSPSSGCGHAGPHSAAPFLA
eukprot:365608-Chlamydomonas_euryale.AAC.19